ncbi:MAG: DUF3795 domain-containing protein [Spirochaetales bacterium]|nr:DUF3795 domain-containing protein [Spirochaetales bacterium]
MKFKERIPENAASYCGVNCNVCYAFLKKKKNCLGCKNGDDGKPEHCRACKIKECAISKGLEYCFDCEEYPCTVLKRLNKSYLMRYGEDLMGNLRQIKDVGVKKFLENERVRWECHECKGVVSVHSRICSECGKDWKVKE